MLEAANNDQLNYQTIKNRSITGLLMLISRTFYIRIIALGGFFFLTTFLSISEIGLFFAVNEIISVLGYFSDIGLAAALIQKKHALSLTDVRTTFTIQQLLVIILIALVFIFTPQIANYYELNHQQIYLLWALTLAFFMASLKTIPSVLLERHLKFDKLVAIETIETLLFYIIAVTLAWQGHGLNSYTVAVLVRGIAGVILIYILSPWHIGFAFSPASVKQLLKFGLPFQGNSLLAMVKDRLLNIVLFKLIGTHGMGIIGWSQTWSQQPLRFITDNVNKVTFPAFSRLQDHPQKLTAAVNRMLFFSSVIIFPFLIGTGIVAQPLINLIPRYQQWQPALFAFYLYLFNSGWAAISTPATNALAAIGQIKIVSRLMIMWTLLTWIIIAPLAYFYGYNGVAIGTAIVAVSSIVPVWLLHRYLKFNILQPIVQPLISSLLMGIIVLITYYGWPIHDLHLQNQIIRLITSILVGICSYAVLLHLITNRKIIPEIKIFIQSLKSN